MIAQLGEQSVGNGSTRVHPTGFWNFRISAQTGLCIKTNTQLGPYFDVCPNGTSNGKLPNRDKRKREKTQMGPFSKQSPKRDNPTGNIHNI